jgi:hypothetical protein
MGISGKLIEVEDDDSTESNIIDPAVLKAEALDKLIRQCYSHRALSSGNDQIFVLGKCRHA